MDFNNYPMEHSSNFKFTPEVIADMLIGFCSGIMLAAILFDILVGSERKEYKNLKKELDDLKKAHLTMLEDSKEQETKNEKDVRDYNELVDRYNLLLKENEDLQKKNSKDVDDYNKLAEELDETNRAHEKDVDDYNTLAEKYNALLEEKDDADKRIERLESRIHRNLSYKE